MTRTKKRASRASAVLALIVLLTAAHLSRGIAQEKDSPVAAPEAAKPATVPEGLFGEKKDEAKPDKGGDAKQKGRPPSKLRAWLNRPLDKPSHYQVIK